MRYQIPWVKKRQKNERRPIGLAAAALTILAVLGPPRDARATPLEVYGRLPSIEDVALSPDGSRLAFVRTKGDARSIAVIALPSGRGITTINMGDHKLRSIVWADSEHLMITTSESGAFYGPADSAWLDESEWFRLTVFDLGRNTFKTYPSTINNRGLNIFGVLSGSVMVRRHAGHTTLFVPALYSQAGSFGRLLFSADLTTDEQRIVRQGTRWTQGWLIDDEGQIAAEKDYSEHDQRWSLSVRRGKELSEIITGHEPIDVPDVLGFGPDDGTLLISSVVDGNPVWKLLSLKDGSLGAPLAESRVLDRPIEDLRTNHMIGGTKVADDLQTVFFDDAAQQRWVAITRAFVGEKVHLVSYSADFSELVVRVEGGQSGNRYELVDMTTHRADPIGEVYEGLGQPLEVRRLSYRATDGMEIPAYLTLPRGREPKNLPLVVLVHGGPAAHDDPEFDWWSQAIADQGYAVLRANFRGSDLSWKFTAAGFGQWGRKMQTDLSDGVSYLAREGIVDSRRACIVGASYGGYAALAAVTLDAGLYRCAISVAGISDLKRMLLRVDDHSGSTWAGRYWDRFMGVTGPADPLVDSLSPIRHVNAVNVPVMLIHGVDDTVVPFKQSSLLYEALIAAGKNVKLVRLKHEDHWLSRGETRLQMLQSSVDFLRANNPPD
jgi:dipeptidyl aminopeptidase/acylaminoacyl peptidase